VKENCCLNVFLRTNSRLPIRSIGMVTTR
jgi:hypothetical protein